MEKNRMYTSQPTSFTGTLLLAGSTSNILNPSNLNQGPISKYAGKPIRGLMRFTYGMAVTTICAPAGGFYHLFAATGVGLYSLAKKDNTLSDKAWQHLKASGQDWKGFANGMWGLVSTVFCVANTVFAFSSPHAFIRAAACFFFMGSLFISHTPFLYALFPSNVPSTYFSDKASNPDESSQAKKATALIGLHEIGFRKLPKLDDDIINELAKNLPNGKFASLMPFNITVPSKNIGKEFALSFNNVRQILEKYAQETDQNDVMQSLTSETEPFLGQISHA